MDLYSSDPQTLASFFEVVDAGVIVFAVNEQMEVIPLCTNSAFRAMYGCSEEGMTHGLPEELASIFEEQARACCRQMIATDFEHVLASGTRWLRVRMIPAFPERAANTVRIFATTIDITATRCLEESLQVVNARLNSIIDSTSEGVVTIDTNRTIRSFNQSASTIFGYLPDEIIGQQLENLLPEPFRAQHPGYVLQFQRSNDTMRPMESRVEIHALRKDGSEFNAEISIAKINVGGKLEFTAFVRDISEHMRLLDELYYRASTDPLTGLNNRRYAVEEGEKELVRAWRFSHQAAAILIDIDDFKSVNDICGHHIGDRVLQEIAKACKSEARQTDIVARWGGEEFLMFLPETGMEGAKRLAERVLDELRGIHVDIERFRNRQITASIGISILGDDSDSLETMINRADRAMYIAKTTGKNKLVCQTD